MSLMSSISYVWNLGLGQTRESVRFHNIGYLVMVTSLPYLQHLRMPVCKSAVCVCRGINRHRVYGNLRSGICNQIPCPRANQSSQNNNLGHKGGPSKNSFVMRGGHHILQEQLTGATRRIPPVPSPPLKINGPLPPPPPHIAFLINVTSARVLTEGLIIDQ